MFLGGVGKEFTLNTGYPGSTQFSDNCAWVSFIDHTNGNFGFTFVIDYGNRKFGIIAGPGNYLISFD